LTQRVSTSLLLQDGINAYWQAFYFSNAKYPLQNITLNGTPLQRNENQVRAGAAYRVLAGQLRLLCCKLSTHALAGRPQQLASASLL
jgi:hypothetical protein